MLWWEMLWAVCGVFLGCATWLVIGLIRLSADAEVKTGHPRDSERKTAVRP